MKLKVEINEKQNKTKQKTLLDDEDETLSSPKLIGPLFDLKVLAYG